MQRSIFLICVLTALFLSACRAWNLPGLGGDGQPCFTNDTCNEGFTCVADICEPEGPACTENDTSCDGAWTTSCQTGKWVRIFNCLNLEKICEDGVCIFASEGDGDEAELEVTEETDAADDAVETDADDETDAEDDTEDDGENDGEEIVCVCGPAPTGCCDGCLFVSGSCDADDLHDLSAHCDAGSCLIDQCENGWVPAAGQLACEEIVSDGDEDREDAAEPDVETPADTDPDVETPRTQTLM